MWEIYLLAVAICFGFGVAILMARKIKAPVVIQEQKIDMAAMAQALAKAMAEHFQGRLASTDITNLVPKENQPIQIDESVIPVNISIDTTESNLDNMAVEETLEDRNLQQAKQKLAQILKKGS